MPAQRCRSLLFWALVWALAAAAPCLAGAVAPATPLAAADLVVAARLRRVDDRAAAADGPVHVWVDVLKTLKGVPGGTGLRFAESAWCGPGYAAGERRLLFLRRVGTGAAYYGDAPWASLCTPGQRTEYLLGDQSVATLSAASLERFLADLEDARRTPPRLQVEAGVSISGSLAIPLTLANAGDQALWLSPSRLRVMLEAGGVRRAKELRPTDPRRDGWIALAPGGTLRGTVEAAPDEVPGLDRVTLWVTHEAALYPYRCWTGTLASTLIPGRR